MITISVDTSDEHIPPEEDIQRWVQAALHHEQSVASLSVHIVDAQAIHQLNKEYRSKDKPTNVLSFPAPIPAGSATFLGDLILCPEVIIREAKEQHKAIADHWAHMLIHGTLHLLGYNHEQKDETKVMEALEARILIQFNIDNPYEAKSS